MIFKYVHKESGMWRGWLKSGQPLELNWGKHGWEFGAGVIVHSNDEGKGDRMMCLVFWRWSAYIPLGRTTYDVDINCEPQWSLFASSDFGLTFHLGNRRMSFDWPWDWHTLAYEKQMHGGAWIDVRHGDADPYSEEYPYTYKLASGEIQNRTATVSKRRHVLTYRAFRAIGWPHWIKESLEVKFSGEVGDRSGSWKGGTIACGYDLLPGETMQQALRRMERERKFT